MRTKGLLSVLLLIMTAALNVVEAQGQELPISDTQRSGCMAHVRGAEGWNEDVPTPTIILTKEGSILSVEVQNFISNCATSDFVVKSSMSEGSDGSPCSLSVNVAPVTGELAADCLCPFNVSFTIHDLEPSSFYLDCWWYKGLVELKEGEPLVLADVYEDATIDGMNFTLRKAFHYAMLTKSEWVGEVRIPSEVSYEGQTYSVTSIYSDTFTDNTTLTRVYIPRTIINMNFSEESGFQRNLFARCSALESIEVEEGNPVLCTIDGVLFNKEKTRLYSYPAADNRTSYTVPEGVTWIDGAAFACNHHLVSISLPDDVTSLGASAFYDCTDLEEVNLPSGLKTLAGYMFWNCQHLKSITIPKGVTHLGGNLFNGCTSLTSVTMPESVTTTDYSVFENCKSLKHVTLSPNLDQINHKMFLNCSSLTEIQIPESVFSVMSNAFQNCSALKTLDLPESIYRLGDSPFSGCKLESLYIRGIIDFRWTDHYWLFDGMGTETKVYVQPSQVDQFKAIYNGSVYPLPETQEKSDYLPFVELGKQWHVVIPYGSPNYYGSISRFWMYEEVERDGKSYVHSMRCLDALCEVQEAGLFREENRRVYKYDETTGRDIMMYDFSLKEGDTFTYEFGLDQRVKCKVMKEGWLEDGPDIVSSCTSNPDGTLDIKYRKLRTWTIGRKNESGEYEDFATWVECIGALKNIFGLIDNGYVKFDNSLAYVERKDNETNYHKNEYLPLSFYSNFVYGCNLPTSESNEEYDDKLHHLTYELEGDRLHVYGDVYTLSGPYNYAYFYEVPTDDPSLHMIELLIYPYEASSVADCWGYHHTDFYVPGFDPNLNYYVSDNHGKEHPVINKMAYRPFVEEGKVWKVGSTIDISDNLVKMVEYYYFDGDTIIDGKTCKQMMCQRYFSPDFSDDYWTQLPSLSKVGAWYEEDKKVYNYTTVGKQFMTMYDFSLEANETLDFVLSQYDGCPPCIIGPKQTEGLKGFKGVYRDIMWLEGEGTNYCTTWLEGVGGIQGPTANLGDGQLRFFLMSCTVGDEVIYLNDEYEDGATPEGARKKRFDFTHTIKIQPKAPIKREKSDVYINSSEHEVARPKVKSRIRKGEEQSLYGEYNDQQLGIHLDPLNDAYLVSIANESGKVVYEKTINAGSIVGLNIDISAYPEGHYTVTVENSQESFTGEFETQATGIKEITNNKEVMRTEIYNLQGQRLSSLQKGLNIVNGKKIIMTHDNYDK